MIRAFFLSLGQLGDRAVLRVLAQTLGVTLLLFLALGAATWWGVQGPLERWTGASATLEAGALAVVVTALAGWLLFRAVAVAVLWVFADGIVAAVEARHYPAALARTRGVPVARAAWLGLGSGLRVVAVNLLLLPVYLALLVTGVGTAAVFFVVNGWLLGRDLGEMVAARHMDTATMRAWRKAGRAERFALGLAVTGLLMVPVAGLLAPVLGAAMATHLFHRNRT